MRSIKEEVGGGNERMVAARRSNITTYTYDPYTFAAAVGSIDILFISFTGNGRTKIQLRIGRWERYISFMHHANVCIQSE